MALGLRSSRSTVVALVTLATFTDLVAYSICVPVLPDLARQLGATPTVVGVLFGSFGVTLLAVSVPMGAISDAIGRRTPLAAGLVLLAAATALFAVSRSLTWLFIARMLQGAADGVTWVVGFAWIADLYSSRERGKVMGYVMSATSAGIMLGPTIGGWLYELGGMTVPFAFVAAMSLLCAAAVLMTHPPAPRDRAPATSVWSVITIPDVAHCAGIVIVTGATLAMFEPVLPLFFSTALHFSPAQVGLLFGAGAMASTVMPIVYGRWTGRWGNRRLTLVGLLLTALWMPMLTLAHDFPSALVLVVVQWMAIALIITPSLAYMADVTSLEGAETFGIGYGVYNAAWAVGLLAGPSMGGFLFERLGFSRLIWVWAPSVALLAWWLARASPRGQTMSDPGGKAIYR